MVMPPVDWGLLSLVQNEDTQHLGTLMLNIVGLCGSLRAASYNRMLMRLAESLMPASMKLQPLEWRDVPVFDADVFAKGFPPAVASLREQVRKADGLLFVTPEYNFSIPGGLKNVIDWL